MDKKRIIPREDFFFEHKGIEYHNYQKHNWLFASEIHEITKEDLEALKRGDCLALNIDNEFVCFVVLKEEEDENKKRIC